MHTDPIDRADHGDNMMCGKKESNVEPFSLSVNDGSSIDLPKTPTNQDFAFSTITGNSITPTKR